MIFLDTNALVYAARDPARNGADPPAHALLRAVAEHAIEAATSTAVLEELWHLELRGRPAGLAGASRDAYELLTPLLSVTDEIVALALELQATRLGANDRIHVATCLANGIDTIVTADDAFDEVPDLRRVDPLDATAVDDLLPRTT